MRKEIHEWMESDVRDDVKRLAKWLRKKKKPILIVLAWSVAMALILIKTFWLSYIEDPGSFRTGLNVPWSVLGVEEHVPRLRSWDYLFLFITSLIAGIMLVDVETTLFSYITAGLISFSIASAYFFVFIWFVLGQGSALDPSFVTTIIFSALLSVLRLVFPFSILITFFGSLFGAFLRDAIQPSATG